MASQRSPFLYPGMHSAVDKLSIIHLKRDLQLPTILKDHDLDDEGYSEGKVVNTRFGSFPHTTMIDIPWGSQVTASRVDTGSRGRKGQPQEKKTKLKEHPVSEEPASKRTKLGEGDYAGRPALVVKEKTEAVPAATGFIHLLPPTPENWTNSLPHRTQVVYTPDYSYILHRIRARPGTNLIEAGAGSGSFTHACARAVFHGYPGDEGADGGRLGKVWSFEFHEQRHTKLQEELKEHGLYGIVEVTHRDVCEGGFLVNGDSPGADAVFLDLPAPWLALPHLVRSKVASSPSAGDDSLPAKFDNGELQPFISPLNPSKSVHICTFSPCIEQVQKTVSVMRQYGWVDISVVELAHKRFEIRRERIGIDKSADHGVQATPSCVEEALQRLLEVEGNFQKFHSTGEKVDGKKKGPNPNSREAIVESLVERKVYKEGRLVHRTEPEVKQHTSYLVFASLPMEWSAEDEAKARAEWPTKFRRDDDPAPKENGSVEPAAMSKRQLKKAARQAQKDRAAGKVADPEAVLVSDEEEAVLANAEEAALADQEEAASGIIK